MFFKYNKAIVNNEEVLYVFIENDIEAAKDFNSNKMTASINSKIIDYFKKNKVDYLGKKVFLVSNNLIIGKIDFSKSNSSNIEKFVDFDKLFKEKDDVEITNIIDLKNYNKVIKVKNELDKYISKVLALNIPFDFEKEAIKTIIVLLRTNCICDIEKYGYIIEKDNIIDIINDQAVEEKINLALKEAKNDCLFINNHLEKLDDRLDNKDIPELKRINIMARAGYSCNQILNHYYPNSKIESIS